MAIRTWIYFDFLKISFFLCGTQKLTMGFQKCDCSARSTVTCASASGITCQRSFPFLSFTEEEQSYSYPAFAFFPLPPFSRFDADWTKLIISRLSARRRGGGQRPLALGGLQCRSRSLGRGRGTNHAMIAYALAFLDGNIWEIFVPKALVFMVSPILHEPEFLQPSARFKAECILCDLLNPPSFGTVW